VQLTSYIIALGSNRRHHRHGAPARVIKAALVAIGQPITATARILHSRPIGPSQRTYANSAVIIECALSPSALLSHLKDIERAFGRRRGQRWSARVIDLDIILWSGGIWASPGLTIPHREFQSRDFVLTPLSEIAPDWHDPVTGLRIRHLKARLDRRRRAA
jgi:2-amino-4-hydroxy-6-hydroxymethyldihydropteridine diphosphokinase